MKPEEPAQPGPVYGGLGSRVPGVAAGRRPPHPWLVLGVSAVLPGVGHVLNGQNERGMGFLFFILLLGGLSFQLTTPEHSFLGRYAGGIFVYGLAVLDAYKWARVRWEVYRRASLAGSGPS